MDSAHPSRYNALVRRQALRSRLRANLELQVAAALLTGGLAATADVVVLAIRGGDEAPLGLAWIAGLGFVLPVAAIAGLALGLAQWALSDAPWLANVRRGASRVALGTRDPEGFSRNLALALALALGVVGMRTLAAQFAARFHDPSLIAWATGLAAPVVLLGVTIVAAAFDAAARPVARRLGGFATPRNALLLLLGAGASVAVWAGLTYESALQQIDVLAYVWLPALGLVHALAWFVLQRTSRGAARGRRRVLLVGTLVLIATAGYDLATYGERAALTGPYESDTVMGRALARAHRQLADRDRDGHAWAYGGEDCNDADAFVFPGAVDHEGDGIDADCYGGDGTPALEGLHGDGDFVGRPRALPRRPNVVLITIDALRPDRLGAYGYARPTSPRIDAFAAESVRFAEVVAPSSRSVRSIPAMFMGVYPSAIQYGGEFLYPSVHESNDLLAERLRAAGYVTHAHLGTDYFSRVRGFFQGFDSVTQPQHATRAQPVDAAIETLDAWSAQNEDGEDRQRPPLFLWVHLFNVHLPYLPDGVPSQFGPAEADWYDTEIVLADEQVGRLLDALRERGLDDSTVVVFASDHGEAHGEHGHVGHAFSLHEEEIRTPLIVRAPGVAPGVVETPVSLIDVAPTVLNLTGQSPPERPIAGRSLLRHLTDADAGTNDERPLFSELLPDGLFPFDQKSVRLGDEKLLWWVRDGRVAYYRLDEDPGETADLADAERPRARELQGLLRAFMATGRPSNQSDDIVRAHVRRSAPALDVRIDARYPGFTLLGYDVGPREVRVGETVDLEFYYRCDRSIARDYFFSIDLVGPDGYRVHDFGAPHYPVYGAYHTPQWEAGEVVHDPIRIVVPERVRRGTTFEAHLVVLDEDRRTRLRFRRADQTRSSLALGTFTVLPDEGGDDDEEAAADGGSDAPDAGAAGAEASVEANPDPER